MTSSSAMTLNSILSVEAGIGCWDLRTGAEQLRYKLCASPPHGLICVGERFLASSQLCESSSSSGTVLALVQAASSCVELSKRIDESARCEQRKHIDCWRRLVGEYLLVGGLERRKWEIIEKFAMYSAGPVNNILVIRQHFSEKCTRSCIKVATCVVFLVLTSTEDLKQVWSSLHYNVHTSAQLMCRCPDDLHSA